MKAFNKIQYILLYLLGLIIIGGASLISGSIGFESFRDPIYYIKTLLKYIAIICVTLATTFAVIDRFMSTNEEYLDCEKDIEDFAKKIYIPSIFNKYLAHINPIRKRNQFEYRIKKKIYKLEVRTDFKERVLNPFFWFKSFYERKHYLKRKQKLESFLDEKFLTEVLPRRFVKYDKISSAVVLSGYYSKTDDESANDFVTKHKTSRIIMHKIPGLLLSFGITSFLSAFLIEIKFNYGALIDISTSIFILLWNSFTAIRYANNYTKEVTLKDIRFRRGIINEYKIWIEQQAKKETLVRENEIDNYQQKNSRSLTNGL